MKRLLLLISCAVLLSACDPNCQPRADERTIQVSRPSVKIPAHLKDIVAQIAEALDTDQDSPAKGEIYLPMGKVVGLAQLIYDDASKAEIEKFLRRNLVIA